LTEIYLDNAATTRMDPRVAEAVLAAGQLGLGNASSIHGPGVRAAARIELARAQLARKLGAAEEEIFFTASGTESNNWALIGACQAEGVRGNHLIVSRIEHPSILAAARWLGARGFQVTEAAVDSEGRVDLDGLARSITDRTVLVSIMHANNEVGVLQDLAAIGRLCASRGCLFHTDACQSFTRSPIDARAMNLDLVSVNAHKIHGPKGVAALFVKRGTRIVPILHGGGQERGLRSGTYNTEGIIGFGLAAEIADETDNKRMTALRDRLIARALETIPGAVLNGPREDRLCNNANFSIEGVSSKKLLFALDKAKVYISVGSACSSGKKTPSHVLLAMGRDAEAAAESFRVSLSKWTTPAEIDGFLAALERSVQSERAGKSHARR